MDWFNKLFSFGQLNTASNPYQGKWTDPKTGDLYYDGNYVGTDPTVTDPAGNVDPTKLPGANNLFNPKSFLGGLFSPSTLMTGFNIWQGIKNYNLLKDNYDRQWRAMETQYDNNLNATMGKIAGAGYARVQGAEEARKAQVQNNLDKVMNNFNYLSK